MISKLVVGSKFPVGSSQSSNFGRFTTARANATRCCSPPESSFGKRFPLSSKPTSSRTAGIRFSISSTSAPMTSSANAIFSVTVRLGNNLKSWNTTPITRRNSGTLRWLSSPKSTPSTSIVPSVGSSSLSINRINVDLPEPDEPTKKTNSPSSIFRSISERAGSGVFGYCFETWSKRITAHSH